MNPPSLPALLDMLEALAEKATPGPYDVLSGSVLRAIRGDLAAVIARFEIPWAAYLTKNGRRSHKQDCAATAAEVHNTRFHAACTPEAIKQLILAARRGMGGGVTREEIARIICEIRLRQDGKRFRPEYDAPPEDYEIADALLSRLGQQTAVGWQDISTAPKDKDVLLLWVGAKRPDKAPPTPAIGAVSSYEADMVWTGGDYRPLSWFTHWQPLPTPPSAKEGA